MMFLAPGFLWGALLVAAAIVALHFIVTRQPRAAVLPTARFVPDAPATAIVKDARPSSLLLMSLRMLLIIAAGAALARPVVRPSRQASARVFLLDVSASAANSSDGIDSVKRLYRAGDAVVVFDSSGRSLGQAVPESLNAVRRTNASGNLSAGLIASLREASALRDRVDSLELVIVSPFTDVEHDAATDSIRKLWHGRARLVRIAAAVDSATSRSGTLELRASSDDPLAVTVALADKQANAANALVIRSDGMSDDDSTRASSNRVLVFWPTVDQPRFAVARSPSVSGGVTSGDTRVIAPFNRVWRFPADSLRSARVIARWADGDPAAIEQSTAGGCIKSVAIPATPIGDLVIRPEFVRLVKEIVRRCDASVQSKPLPSAVLASLGGGGPLAIAKSFAGRDDLSSRLAPWLLGIALAAALAELFLRRNR